MQVHLCAVQLWSLKIWKILLILGFFIPSFGKTNILFGFGNDTTNWIWFNNMTIAVYWDVKQQQKTQTNEQK